RDQGMEIDAIPVFPHRRFRHGFIFINTGKGIKSPKDLIGKKVGVKSFQATAILWMRGILEHEYGVPHKSIDWYSDLDEDIEFERPGDLRLTRLPDTTSVEKELVEGRLDALLHTDLIEPIVNKDERVARLFPDHQKEEVAFFKKTGMFPIMHVVGIRRDLVKKYPWLPINLYKAFNESKAAGMRRMFNPRVVPLAWYTEYWEAEREMLGPDPWEYGLSDQNRKTLGAMIGYSHEQGLIKRRLEVDELFLDVSEGKKRGTFRV
ncbi:MAG: ABC transporter substrate-binding protein, partial [Hyphomicrobiaceae bacterium]